ncbi:DUF805 domain-containing protein [Brucella pseudogrignonensis]|uniref:DUF805 domain-containing protein n=1 Tax=Brucella pseudogrignonensis TaxID=419475 RepID=UPI000CFCECFF|nr:DUF805 domain-containing protein [Brucella pseudogrignonensis]MQP40969.1 DUF805 domain-containing protein [Ochrobactrum sp. MYb237]PQZ40922.1 hypothetical protein CQ059_16875 [Brucella pseudogrignonensis]PRA40359.1 hypothetical protein CQ063_12280 [Brucella pseudogrignonensis]PRA68952.1 hypothetical protein CQ055_12165 [Brucella pseudogrignonensis]
MHYYTDAMRNYAVLSGRASRSQYWLFSLTLFIMLVVAMVIDQTVGDTTRNEPAGLFTAIVFLAHLLPAIAVTVRRLHDTDRSGLWVFAGFVPLIGQIALLVFLCLPSRPGANCFESSFADNVGAKPGPHSRGMAQTNAIAAAPLDQLEKIASLRASGAIDEDEFKQLKANVISRPSH